jgi:hypothetical protein
MPFCDTPAHPEDARGRRSQARLFLLGLHLGRIDALAAAIASIDAEVDPGRERRKAPLDPADKDSA